MTETEWLACTDPQPMLEFLLRSHVVPATEMRTVAAMAMRRRSGWGRKFRLYACGWSRRFWDKIEDQRLRNGLDITEQYTDGLTSDTTFRMAKRQAGAAYNAAIASEGQDGWGTNVSSFVLDIMSLRFLPGWNPHMDTERGLRFPEAERTFQELSRYHCCLLRDLFGPLPFRSISIATGLLAWNEFTVAKLAQDIYNHHRFDDLPILADALEEAGCQEADILAHCRGPVPHARGCWVVDLILGKK